LVTRETGIVIHGSLSIDDFACLYLRHSREGGNPYASRQTVERRVHGSRIESGTTKKTILPFTHALSVQPGMGRGG